MARTPQVTEGFREPRSARKMEAAEEARRVPGPQPLTSIPSGKTVFQFTAARYRLQVTAPEEIKNPQTGRTKQERAKVVVANENIAILDNKKDADAIEYIRNHNDYGKDFWDFQEVLEGARKRKTEMAVETVMKDPEARKAVLEALKASGDDDFTPRAGKQKAAA